MSAQRRVAALEDPTKAAYPGDGNRQELYEAAERACNVYVRDVAETTARMIRALFPDAVRVVFDQNMDSGEIGVDLLVIYGPDEAILWYEMDDAQLRKSDIARVVAETEKDAGELLMPTLDESTKSKIEELISVAQERDWDDGWYAITDLIINWWHSQQPEMYYGDVHEINLDEELANPDNNPASPHTTSAGQTFAKEVLDTARRLDLDPSEVDCLSSCAPGEDMNDCTTHEHG